jgi:hypothetical protein
MAKSHGARQQKKLAKQKAKRAQKRATLAQRTSNDPTIRLRRAERWPVVHSLVSETLWDEGIGYVIIARQELEGQLVFAIFLVDVLCLGVKDAFWRVDSVAGFKEVVEQVEDSVRRLSPTSPECARKIVEGAVEFAESFGFPPHRDYHHAARLLDGIDPTTCTKEFEFGEDGRPHYIQGPFETPERAAAIAMRVQQVGGHFTVLAPGTPRRESRLILDESEDWDEADAEDE